MKNILLMQELIDIILCVLLMHMGNNIHNLLMKSEAVVGNKYHQIKQ